VKESRCQYLKESIPGPTGPFSEISGWARDDAQKAIEEASGTLKRALDEMLWKVQNAFERSKRRKANDTEHGKKFRAELHELVAEARRILNGVAKENLELCKQYK
jgi:vacuolar-type H+-ATPase subunit E/Vma4